MTDELRIEQTATARSRWFVCVAGGEDRDAGSVARLCMHAVSAVRDVVRPPSSVALATMIAQRIPIRRASAG